MSTIDGPFWLTAIASEFICGQLASACEANQAAQNLCTAATNAASSAPPGGAQADAFNAVFGITTVRLLYYQ
jgi:hypothetical protein